MQAPPGTLSKRRQTIDAPDAIETSSRNASAERDAIELIVATDAEEH